MDRTQQIQMMVDHWDFRKDMSAEEIRADYIVLLTKIAKLERAIKNAKIALDEQ